MGQKIKGAPAYLVKSNVEINVNAPQLFIELQMNPNIGVKHAKAVNLLAILMNKLAVRVCQVGDPELITLLKRIKYVEDITPPPPTTGFEDI